MRKKRGWKVVEVTRRWWVARSVRENDTEKGDASGGGRRSGDWRWSSPVKIREEESKVVGILCQILGWVMWQKMVGQGVV